jgi:hypothetical protein
MTMNNAAAKSHAAKSHAVKKSIAKSNARKKKTFLLSAVLSLREETFLVV